MGNPLVFVLFIILMLMAFVGISKTEKCLKFISTDYSALWEWLQGGFPLLSINLRTGSFYNFGRYFLLLYTNAENKIKALNDEELLNEYHRMMKDPAFAAKKPHGVMYLIYTVLFIILAFAIK
jgi:hypothetical protein